MWGNKKAKAEAEAAANRAAREREAAKKPPPSEQDRAFLKSERNSGFRAAAWVSKESDSRSQD